MTLQQIYYLLEVAKTGSINKSAEKLFVSQPTLTAAIKDVESELDITIFRRTSRGVRLTREGTDFLARAGELYQHYELLMDRFRTRPGRQKFGVSIQHYSFAVKSFSKTIMTYGTDQYEFSLRETQTRRIIEDVASGRSDLGILYRSSYNKRIISRMLQQNKLEFHHISNCPACVVLWKHHPLSGMERLHLNDLKPYPYLLFEQGDSDTAFLSEEILSEHDHTGSIHVTDRATMMNLMAEVNGYTIGSGLIGRKFSEKDFVVIPVGPDDELPDTEMEIGYIKRVNVRLSEVAETYIRETRRYLLAGRS